MSSLFFILLFYDLCTFNVEWVLKDITGPYFLIFSFDFLFCHFLVFNLLSVFDLDLD